MLMRLLIFILLAYLLILVAVYFLQQRLLYFPSPSQAPESQLKPLQLTPWPEQNFKGYLGPEPQQSKGMVLVFHGNAGAAWQRSYYTRALTRLGYRVLLVEYPGYGGRAGTLNQQSLTEDGLQTLKLAGQHFEGPLYLWGESLGAGVVASVAARLSADSRVAGLILMAPWDSLTVLAQHHYWYLPVKWLLKDKYDSITSLSAFDKPVAMLVAGQDTIIPNRHSLALYESLSAPKSIWRFDNASHNNWPNQADAKWWQEVMNFVSAADSVTARNAN
ncbi:hypothetical protein AT746_12190 [Lacimicrobium alkaliphilum]|uniref:Serine aminopeptidase S33 domain-containing protein n=2 Tax=Lacimicrobium alkaliphilum TaxID=1526571 RepID=A0A0U3BA43_9ALTE|nr:hypothetical protein AT746_12190 [Lacimicrobium alkaliphilum]